MSDSLVTDTSSVKACGLQISNQFSIKNRVIASPPLSIAAAPGLILAHGHVATHLKNTPADVFVSSDGGYTWLKALDGPHHYQIANRGGLLVAVPAETLWPDVLRFSTDEGRCWHTIPLRTGQWSVSESNRYHINNDNSDIIKEKVHDHNDESVDDDDDTQNKVKLANVEVTDIPYSKAHGIVLNKDTIFNNPSSLTSTAAATTTTVPAGTTTVSISKNITSSTPGIMSTPHNNHFQQNDDDDKWSMSSQKSDEIVVFTGLVTEPGGRAMAAAVYGYGTATQRWRVAVVDFRTNGMIKRKCTDDDYEIWIPHSSEESGKDGCLLGVKEQFRRLKKDSLCANEYGMETRVQVEFCHCTQADYECEYGFYRQPGSLNCVRNPYIPPLDPCTLSKEQRQTIHHLGYRLIPGDRCIGGWKPPLWNQTILDLVKSCPHEVDDESAEHNSTASIISVILLLFGLTLLLALWIRSNRRNAQMLRSSSNYRYNTTTTTTSVTSFKTTTNNALNRIQNWFIPVISWKRNNINNTVSGNHGLSSRYGDSQTVLWPHLSINSIMNSMNWNNAEQNVNLNPYGTKCIQPKYFNKQKNQRGDNNMNSNHVFVDSKIVTPKKSTQSTLIPSFLGGVHQHFSRKNNSLDVTNLLEAEEISASLTDLNVKSSLINLHESFPDPLASFTHTNQSTKQSNGLINVFDNKNDGNASATNNTTNYENDLNQTNAQNNTPLNYSL
ncbi:unnamed protein product [Heterobilharzia americana]|nr:unnamed protein product [Heterobilharzia americana]